MKYSIIYYVLMVEKTGGEKNFSARFPHRERRRGMKKRDRKMQQNTYITHGER